MASKDVSDLVAQARKLSLEEQLDLIARLVHVAQRAAAAPPEPRSWRDIAGIAPYPLAGEDAQQWVSRTRREGDEHRERVLRGGQ